MKQASVPAIGDKTLIASSLLLAGVFYSRFINLLMTILLARLLVPADFGLVALGTTLLLMLNSITDISVASALIHHKDLADKDFDTAFTLSTLRGILVSIILIVSGFIMAHAYNDERLIGICAGLSLRPFLTGIGSPRYVLYSKELQFGTVAVQEGLNYTTQLVVSVAIAYYTKSYWAIVAGATFATVMGTIVTYWVAPYWPRLSVASWRKLLGFSVWLTLNQFLTIVGNRFENFLAGGWLGLTAFGAMNVGNNMAGVITQSAIAPIQRVLFPSFAKISGDADRLKTAFQKSQASLFALGFAVGVGTALVAEPFVYLTLGPNWPIAVIVIQTIAPVLGAQIVFGPANALCNAIGATRMLFNRGLVLVLFRVPVVLAGLYFYGLPGLLYARVFSGGIVASMANFYLVRKLIDLSVFEQIFVTWRSWVSGLAMTIVCLIIRHVLGPISSNHDALVMIVLQSVFGAAAYCGIHAVLWLTTGKTTIGIEGEAVKFLTKAISALRRKRQRARSA
ncbi:PST family polysaccharide transporter [Rhizobium sp. BK049]|uniref:lipopolysaccharide biosynthesis protein n=1 Tax=Rhizobium sp. BK049 TaxID=2587095 RepID=UPI00161325EB|nr:lipopolysaccharide biosynthesis protein [Rhizobium sp. BK049]MBB3351023.1 PST family polysaccharide transporter [Rhizobium sp. BK049]